MFWTLCAARTDGRIGRKRRRRTRAASWTASDSEDDSEDGNDGGQKDSAMEVVTDRQKGQRRRVLATPRPRALPAATASSSLMPSSLDDLLEDFNPRDPKEGRRAPETDGHEDGDEDEDHRVEVTADVSVVFCVGLALGLVCVCVDLR